jgi:hypothetical protein
MSCSIGSSNSKHVSSGWKAFSRSSGWRSATRWRRTRVDDVDCGRLGVGRDVLRSSYEVVHRQFYRTVHQVVGHTIEFVDTDHATGKVLMRAEHEVSDRWIVAMLCMFDTYERRGGEWFFVRRKPESWYVTDYGVQPRGPDWRPEGWDGRTPRLPHLFSTWATFWDGNAARTAELTDFPV